MFKQVTDALIGIISVTEETEKKEKKPAHPQQIQTTNTLNTKNKKGNTALHKAVSNLNPELVNDLLISPVEIDALNDNENTAMHLAVKLENLSIVDTLKRNTASTTLGDGRGNTALHLAAEGNNSAVTANVLNDSSVNLQNKSGETALHKAVLHGNLENVNVLLANESVKVRLTTKPIVMIASMSGGSHPGLSSVLHYAFYRKLGIPVIEALMAAKAPSSLQNQKGLTAAHLAVRHDEANLLTEKHLNYLLRGTVIGSKSLHNSTVLHYAALNNQLSDELFTIVLEKSTKDNDVTLINTMNDSGITPLIYAIMSKNSAKTNALLNVNADVNLYKRSSPLHLAIQDNDTILAIKLINAGADTNALDQNKQSPLLLAAMNGNVTIIEVLSHAKADFTGEDGKLAVVKALLNNHIEAATRLIELGANADSHIKPGVSYKENLSISSLNPSSSSELSKTKLSLKDGTDKTGKIEAGDTPLHLAVKIGNKRLAEACLTQKPALVNAQNDQGKSPAIYAIRMLDSAIAHTLYTKGEPIKQSLKCPGITNAGMFKAPRENTLIMSGASRGFDNRAQLKDFFENANYQLTEKQQAIKEELAKPKDQRQPDYKFGTGYKQHGLMSSVSTISEQDGNNPVVIEKTTLFIS